MSLTDDEHFSAAVTALEREPFRYWVSGFYRPQMKRVQSRLEERFPERSFVLVEFFPPADQCVIYDVAHFDYRANLAAIAKRREALLGQGITALPE